jgi:hypothetical protein
MAPSRIAIDALSGVSTPLLLCLTLAAGAPRLRYSFAVSRLNCEAERPLRGLGGAGTYERSAHPWGACDALKPVRRLSGQLLAPPLMDWQQTAQDKGLGR